MREFLRISEAAKAFNLTEGSIRRAIARGDLPYVCPNGQTRGWRVEREALLRWLRSCRRVNARA